MSALAEIPPKPGSASKVSLDMEHLQVSLDVEHPSGQFGYGTSCSSSWTWSILQVSLDVGHPLLDQDKLAYLSLLAEKKSSLWESDNTRP